MEHVVDLGFAYGMVYLFLICRFNLRDFHKLALFRLFPEWFKNGRLFLYAHIAPVPAVMVVYYCRQSTVTVFCY